MTADPLGQLVAPLRSRAESAALLFDFDGTLSPTVPDPADARPVSGAVELLEELADRYWRVAVVSGRPVSFLRQVLPSTLVMSGQYGLELEGAGLRPPGHDLTHWREAVADAAERAAAAGIPAMRVEPKGASLTLHWREHPEIEPEVVALADELSEVTGLVCRPAKKSVELHPPVAADKGTALRHLCEGAEAALYVGDDLGDLPAFAALADLRAEGLLTVGIAVASAELPAPVRDAADATVDGAEGTIALLQALLG